MPEWTEGVCDDGAAILRDGQLVPISALLKFLNGAEAAREALRDLMSRFALDSADECRDVSERLEITNVDALWEAAQKASAALDATR